MNRYRKYFKLIRPILFKKPYIFLRLISNYIQIIFMRKKCLKKVEIGVNFDCQCSCNKCSSHKMKNIDASELTLSQYKDCAKQVISLGALIVNFTGGETLLNKDILEIIKCFEPNKLIISINTNAILLSHKKIDELDSAGVDIIKLSIDSPLKEEHDTSRNYNGCFDKVIEALDYINNKENLIAHISTVCTKSLLRSGKIWDIISIAERFNANLGITVPTLSGRWENSENELLDDQDREILSNIIKNSSVVRDIDEGYTKSRCPAGLEEIYITAYGDVIPCPFIQYSFGNIQTEKIKDMWTAMTGSELLKNNKSNVCIAGEDRDFIEKYLKPLRDDPILPKSIKKIQ